MNKIIEAIRTRDPFGLLVLGLAAFVIITFIAFIVLFIRDKKKEGTFSRKKNRRFLIKSYRVFTSLSLTKMYVEQMRKRYEMRYPEDTKSLQCKAMRTTYIIWGISALLIVLLFGFKPNFYMAYLTVLTITVLNRELLSAIVGGMEGNLRANFNEFLSDVRHGFSNHGMIDRAITDAAELSGRRKSGRIMKMNAEKMLAVLESNDKESSIRLYNESISNRFLRLFLSVAVYVSEYGDKVVNNVSVFLLNINTLKTDIYLETMNIKDTNYKFSGMLFVVLAPVYMLDGIKAWSMGISPDLAEFYRGQYGLAVKLLIYVVTVVMYVMINELKEKNVIGASEHHFVKSLSRIKFISRVLNNYAEKNQLRIERAEDLLYRVGEALTAKQFLLERIMYSLGLFIVCIIISVSSHRDNRIQLLNSTQFIGDEAGVISDRYIQTASELVLRYTDKYKNLDTERSVIEGEVRKEGAIRSDTVMSVVIDEIMLRVTAYQKEYYHWYELLVATFIAVLGYWAPYGMLLYRRKVLYMNMGNEVAQFQSTIIMVKNLNNTTVLKVLELMESFAVIFKESLKQCINDYSAGDIDALERLKLRERYEPFRRIVDNLIIADKIGMQGAFDEIEEERKVSQEMMNQDAHISREKRVIAGSFMQYIPGIITAALYWIIPFAINSLGGLLKYDEIMNSMK